MTNHRQRMPWRLRMNLQSKFGSKDGTFSLIVQRAGQSVLMELTRELRRLQTTWGWLACSESDLPNTLLHLMLWCCFRDRPELLGEHMANHGHAEHDLSELRSFNSSENGRGEMKFKDFVCVGGRLRILL